MAAPGITLGWRSEAGRRAANEDAVVAERLPDGGELIVLADGMGGHRAGAVASRSALSALSAAVRSGQSLEAAVKAANAAIYTEAQQDPALEGMGTTMVALLRAGRRYEVANVGDSRAYRIGDGRVRQITADHSFVAEAIAEGSMSAEEARRSPWRNALTRSLGSGPEVEVDVFGPFDAGEPHLVVLCSDGFHGSVSPRWLAHGVAHGADLQAAARRLTEMAYRNGSTDNISVAVVRFGGAERPLGATRQRLGRAFRALYSRDV